MYYLVASVCSTVPMVLHIHVYHVFPLIAIIKNNDNSNVWWKLAKMLTFKSFIRIKGSWTTITELSSVVCINVEVKFYKVSARIVGYNRTTTYRRYMICWLRAGHKGRVRKGNFSKRKMPHISIMECAY